MKPFSYVFAGSSQVSIRVLEILLRQKNFQCKGIITRPDKIQGRGLKKQANVLKELALFKKIPYWTDHSFSDPSFLKEISDLNLNFCFVCAYGKILAIDFLNLFPERCLNLHFSLLPRWRGAAPIQRALMEGDLKTGVCLQVMKEKLDAGDLIASKSFPIEESDNALNLFEKSFKATEFLLQENLTAYLEGKINPLPQDSSFMTYAKKIDKESVQIVWTQSSIEIHNKVRALYLGPQAFCFFGQQGIKKLKTPHHSRNPSPSQLKNPNQKAGSNQPESPNQQVGSSYKLNHPNRNLLENKKEAGKKRLKIYRSQINTQIDKTKFQAGEICQIEKNRLSVSCGKGVLDLLEVQREGKKRQKIQDFLAGHHFKLGDRLS